MPVPTLRLGRLRPDTSSPVEAVVRFSLPLLAGLCIVLYATGSPGSDARAEGLYLARLAVAALAAAAFTAVRAELAAGAAVLTVAAVWILPAGPPRATVVGVLLVASVFAAALLRRGRATERDGLTLAVPLALGLQALLRPELLLGRPSPRALVALLVLPVAGAAATALLARRQGNRAWIAAAAALAVGPGWNVATSGALIALAAGCVLAEWRRVDAWRRAAAVAALVAPSLLHWRTGLLAALAGLLLATRSRNPAAPAGAAIDDTAAPAGAAMNDFPAPAGATMNDSPVPAGAAIDHSRTPAGPAIRSAGAPAGASVYRPLQVGAAIAAVALVVFAGAPGSPVGAGLGASAGAAVGLLLALVPGLLAVVVSCNPLGFTLALAVAASWAADGTAALAAPAALAALASLPWPEREQALARWQMAWSVALLFAVTVVAGYPWLRTTPVLDVLRAVGVLPWRLGAPASWLPALLALGVGLVAPRRTRALGGIVWVTAGVVALAFLGRTAEIRQPLLVGERALTGADPTFRLDFDGGARPVSALVVESALANGAGLHAGTPVATLTAELADGRRAPVVLHAGEETGEWAARRADLLAAGLPPAPSPWIAWIVGQEDPRNPPFFGQRYRARLLLPPGSVARAIAVERDAGLPADVSLAIYALETAR